GDQYGNNANTAAAFVDSYTVANLRAGLDIESGDLRISPFVGINNLFDESYTANVRLNAFGGRFYEPAPGRNGYAGVTLNWGFYRLPAAAGSAAAATSALGAAATLPAKPGLGHLHLLPAVTNPATGRT